MNDRERLDEARRRFDEKNTAAKTFFGRAVARAQETLDRLREQGKQNASRHDDELERREPEDGA